MKRLAVAVVLSLAALPAAPVVPLIETAVAAEANDPEAIVRAIYGQWADPCCNYFNVVDTYFSPQLARLYNAVQDGAGDDIEYAIDFDIFLDAQDEDTVTGVETSVIDGNADGTVVAVSYEAFGERHEATYTFVQVGGRWRIDDMGWGADRSGLRAMLDDLREQQAAR